MTLNGPDCSPLGRSEDAAFGHWLAGFIDGEGCFVITPNSGSLVCRFQLCLRDDDAPLLDWIVSKTELGVVYPIVASGTSKPQAMWMVGNRVQTLALVALLDTYGLRSKKARDYAIWREAVLTWNGPRSTVRRARLQELRARLRAVRAYETAGDAPNDVALPGDDQLGLLTEHDEAA